MIHCVKCEGTGTCLRCKGCGRKGFFLRLPPPTATACLHCKGSGRCPECNGKGELPEPVYEPEITVRTSLSMPTSISMAAFTGARWRSFSVPAEVADWPEEKQLEEVGLRCRHHFEQQGGRLSFFGNIVGYAWHPRPAEWIRLDINGRVIQEVENP
jgi:hypothetical protein